MPTARLMAAATSTGEGCELAETSLVNSARARAAVSRSAERVMTLTLLDRRRAEAADGAVRAAARANDSKGSEQGQHLRRWPLRGEFRRRLLTREHARLHAECQPYVLPRR